MKVLAVVLAWIASLVLAILIYSHSTQPHCPTEDSCTVNYRDGQWVVIEVTP